MRVLRRRWWVGLIVVAFIMLLPITVSAATNSDIIAILNASIVGLVNLTRLAYCAAGVNALCP